MSKRLPVGEGPSNSVCWCLRWRLSARALCPGAHTARTGAVIRIAPGGAPRHNLPQMGRTVLIVDDHSGFRASARELLECEGYRWSGRPRTPPPRSPRPAGSSPTSCCSTSQLPDIDGVRVSHEIARGERQSSARGPGLEPRRLRHGGRAGDVPGVRLHLQVAAERRSDQEAGRMRLTRARLWGVGLAAALTGLALVPLIGEAQTQRRPRPVDRAHARDRLRLRRRRAVRLVPAPGQPGRAC